MERKEDIFDINWNTFVTIKKGRFYTKKNDDRFNCYEMYFAEYEELLNKVIIETYIQLIPAKGYGPFLERKTTVKIEFKNVVIGQLKVQQKSFLNFFLIKVKKYLLGI